MHASENFLNVKQSIYKYFKDTLAPAGEIEIDVFNPDFDPTTLSHWIRIFFLSNRQDASTTQVAAGDKKARRMRLLVQISLFARRDDDGDPYRAAFDTWIGKIESALTLPRGINFYNFYPGGVFNAASTTAAWSECPFISLVGAPVSEYAGEKDQVYHQAFSVEMEYYCREE